MIVATIAHLPACTIEAMIGRLKIVQRLLKDNGTMATLEENGGQSSPWPTRTLTRRRAGPWIRPPVVRRLRSWSVNSAHIARCPCVREEALGTGARSWAWALKVAGVTVVEAEAEREFLSLGDGERVERSPDLRSSSGHGAEGRPQESTACVDVTPNDTSAAEQLENFTTQVERDLQQVPTNFNIKGFRHAVGSSGRVTMHDRNMLKMLLVAVDYDLEPLVSSSPPSACLSTVSAANYLGDYWRFDMTAGADAGAELDNTAIYLNGDNGNSQSGGGNGASPWLDSLLLKASRVPTFEQQQQQLRELSAHGLGRKAEEEERVPSNGTDTSKGARASDAAAALYVSRGFDQGRRYGGRGKGVGRGGYTSEAQGNCGA